MDAIELLTRDHRTVDDLFDRLTRTDREELEEDLVHELARVLTLHTIVEEQHFYPALRDENAKLLERFGREHDGVKKRLSRLLDLSADDDEFMPELEALRAEVEAHVAVEEQELFPLARKSLSEDQLESLGDEMAVTRDALSELEPKEYVDTESVLQP